MNRAEFAAGEQQIKMLHPVLGQDRHPVAMTNAGQLSQSIGQPVGALIHLRIAQAQFRSLTGIHDGERVRTVERPPAQVIADMHGVCFLTGVADAAAPGHGPRREPPLSRQYRNPPARNAAAPLRECRAACGFAGSAAIADEPDNRPRRPGCGLPVRNRPAVAGRNSGNRDR